MNGFVNPNGFMSSTRNDSSHQGCYNVQSRVVVPRRVTPIDQSTQLETPRPVRSSTKMLRKQPARLNLKSRLFEPREEKTTDIQPSPLASPEKPRREPILTSTIIESHRPNDYSPSMSVIRSPLHQLEEPKSEYQDIQNAFCNYLYESPSSSPVKQQSNNNTNTSVSRFSDEEFRTCHASMFTEETDWSEIYICRRAHQARMPGELSIEFTDRLRFIQLSSTSNEWCLVQNVDTGLYGYVPKDTICKAENFIDEIQRLRL